MTGFSVEERRALCAHIRAAEQEAARSGAPVCAWLSRPVGGIDHRSLFSAAAGGERFFWEEPGDGLRLVAAGAVSTLIGAGRSRSRVAEQAAALFRGGEPLPSAALDGPVLTGGFGFSDARDGRVWRGFAPVRFVVPEHLVAWREGRAIHTTTVLAHPGADPASIVNAAEARWRALCTRAERAGADRLVRHHDAVSSTLEGCVPERFRIFTEPSPARFRAIVQRALDEIRAGRFEKVVLARSCTVSRTSGFDPDHVLALLRSSNPRCFRFALGCGDATLLAATPERLVRLEGRAVTASALAGSRGRGRSPEEDARLAAGLRESKKEQEEHALVARALRAVLERCCDRVSSAEAPALLRLESIQHLHTPMTAVLRPGAVRSVLDLASRIHPSPAVAGAPQEAALSFLRANETVRRGWYAGAVGWLSPGGDGELAVALRTVLLRGELAVLHAGAGVVEGSSPEGELAETRLKLRGGLSALLEL